MTIKINIESKRPTVIGTPVIVCGNSDYTIQFTFDAEWSNETNKTARFTFVRAGRIRFQDVAFSGTSVTVPVLSDVREVMVGVYAGELHTTTPAKIPCERSILCGDVEEYVDEGARESLEALIARVESDLASGAYIGPQGERGPKGERGYTVFPLVGVNISRDNGTIESANQYISAYQANFPVHITPEMGDMFYTTAGDLCLITSVSSDGKGGYNLTYRRIVNLRGPSGVAGKTPEKGVDYFTEADKNEIAAMAAELVETPGGGSGADVTAESIITALGYVPADEEDVSLILDALDTVETVIPSTNLNDGVYEYGRFATDGSDYDKDTPLEGAFRNVNYLPVEGGRTMTIYFDAYEWNKNNKGYGASLVEYDADKNIIGTRRTIYPYTASKDGFTLAANTAYVRLCVNLSGTAITTPLAEIKMALYYIEDAQLAYVSYDPTIVEEKVFNAAVVSVLRGKKIVYDGDSIAESRISGTAANGGGYAKLIADKVGGIYVNQAVGGARLCANSEKHSVVNNLTNLPKDGDLYCFEGGINDFWGNTAIGECSLTDYTGTVDPATICGAMETIFRYALDNFVGKPICFVITHKVQNTAYSANSSGKTFKDYRDAMVKVCEKYSIPYYDAFTESGLNGWNTVQSNAYLTANSSGAGDGTHPNEEGYKKYYVPQLLDLFSRMMPIE